MASVDVVASFRGGRRVALQLVRAAGSVDDEVREAVRESGEAAVFVFRAKAPRRTGRLQRGVRSTVRGLVAVITAHARSREGFDYVGVTRFGHKVGRIVPRHQAPDGRYLAPIPGVGPRWVEKRPALRITVGRRAIFRASVAGYRPGRDWARTADPAVERLVEAAGTRAGKRIAARVG